MDLSITIWAMCALFPNYFFEKDGKVDLICLLTGDCGIWGENHFFSFCCWRNGTIFSVFAQLSCK